MNHSLYELGERCCLKRLRGQHSEEGPRSGEPVFPVNPKAEKIGRRITEPNDINESYTTLI